MKKHFGDGRGGDFNIFSSLRFYSTGVFYRQNQINRISFEKQNRHLQSLYSTSYQESRATVKR